MITGAQAMVKCLEAESVSVLFGYPGAAIAPFYDSLAESGIRHILVRTEQNAGHAASGYARITGRPAVCVATSGPGATNLFTAIATAYSDSIPLIAITGQVCTESLGRDVFQEVDTTGAAEAFTKYTYLVKNATDIPRVFKEAFHIASTGRKGPVLIDMPMDVQKQLIDFHYPIDVQIRGYKPRFRGHAVQIKRVAEAIREAKRPLLCVGGGVFAANAQDPVRRFCTQCSMPVVSTMMGIGIMPSRHPLYYGMLGQSGTNAANEAVQESDLLVVIGARMGDRAVTSPQQLESHTTVVHIDIDAAEIGKNVGTTIPLVGDAAPIMEQLIEQNPCGEWHKWLEWLEGRRLSKALANKTDFVEPNNFVRLLSENMEDDAIYVSDVGLNQIWSAKNVIIRTGRFLTTGGMGTMGYAIPAAIGAKLAAPERQVVAVCGDGAFQMSLMELATARQHGVTVKLIVMRNDCLGMVRDIQRKQYRGREIAVDLNGSPDIEKIAQAYGMCFRRLRDMSEANNDIKVFLGSKESFLLECTIDPMQSA